MKNLINRALVAKKNVINRALVAKKKILLLFAALLMASTTLLAETVNYIDANGQTQSVNASEVTSSANTVTWGEAGQTTWYVVTGTNVTLSKGAVCEGNVNLILADGARLTATGWFDEDHWYNYPGIQVSDVSNSLTIYGQDEQSGQLIATGADGAAGIGGGSNVQQGSGYNITINGGKVTANGGTGSDGIGNGNQARNPASNIKVATYLIVKEVNSANPTYIIENNGGDLAEKLAGKQHITIELAPVTISHIDVYGQEKSVDASEVTSSANTVYWGEAGQTTWYVVTGTNVTLSQGAVCEGAVNLILADGAKLTAEGWYDERTWTGYPAIQVSGDGNSLTIYAQSTDPNTMGELIATGGENGAGIGGGYLVTGSNITINGGVVTSTGGGNASGIGGGLFADGTNITINGGVVTATDKGNGSGIGGGVDGNGSNITINGGTVTAQGGQLAAGIGGGMQGSGFNISILAGDVMAKGGDSSNDYPAGDAIGNGQFAKTDASNIIVSTSLVVKADGNNPPTTVIANDGGDLANSLKGLQYVIVESETKGLEVIHNIQSPVHGSKFIRDGQFVIICDGKTYNAQGIEL